MTTLEQNLAVVTPINRLARNTLKGDFLHGNG